MNTDTPPRAPYKRRTIHLKAGPSINTLSPIHIGAMTLCSPPSHLTPESVLQVIPPRRQNTTPGPVLLTCPTCAFIDFYVVVPSSTASACANCMHRFKKHERKEWAKLDTLTTFPCLLETHAVVRDRTRCEEEEEEEEAGHGIGGMSGAVWGQQSDSEKRSVRSRNESGESVKGTGGCWSLVSI